MDDRPAKARRSSLPPVLADTRSRASNSSARPPPHPRRYFSSHLAPRVTAPPPPSIRVRSRTKNRPPAPRGSFSPGRRSINVIQFGQLGRPSCTILGGAVAGVLGSSSPRERERERERGREEKKNVSVACYDKLGPAIVTNPTYSRATSASRLHRLTPTRSIGTL